MLDGTRTVQDLVGAASTSFPGPVKDIERDVREFVWQLDIRGMVETVHDAAYALAAGTGWVRDEASVLLIDLVSGRRRALTGTGASIFEAALQGGGRDVVTQRMRSAYPDAPRDLARHVEVLLNELCAEGLLRRLE